MQNRLLVELNDNKIKELLISIVFIIPYTETFIGGTWAIGENAVGRTIIVVEFIIIAACILRNILKGVRIFNFELEVLFFCYYTVLVLFFATDVKAHNISVAMWMTVPVLCAYAVKKLILDEGLDFGRIIYYGVYVFSAYSVLLVTYNILFLGLLGSGNRITALAGGPVVYGYTLAVYFALVITNKELFNNTEIIFFKVLFSVIALMSGSRGSFWPIIMLWLFDYFCRKISYRKLLVAVGLIFVIMIINPIEIVSHVMPRLLSNTDSSRINSAIGTFSIFTALEPSQIIIGFGPGDFFPYQAWVNRNVVAGTSAGNMNNFFYDGIMMLVQPHNSFIYYIMELGIIGLFTVLFILVKNVHLMNPENRVNRIVLIGVITLANLLDSIFIVEPGVSFVMWLIVFFCSTRTIDY